MEHFGIKLIKRKYSFKLTRDEFALINTKPSLPKFKELVDENAYTDASGKEYSYEWCKKYRELCLENYDLNLHFFALLDADLFEKSLRDFLNKYTRFMAVEDLKKYDGVEGYYLMVLDNYKQVYIGKSNNVKKRILQHWTKTKSFDRTLLPMYAVTKSCFSIDFFRALDTTRIYVWKKKIKDGIEGKLINDFPREYCTNRIGGDISSGIEALATMNVRNLQN